MTTVTYTNDQAIKLVQQLQAERDELLRWKNNATREALFLTHMLGQSWTMNYYLPETLVNVLMALNRIVTGVAAK